MIQTLNHETRHASIWDISQALKRATDRAADLQYSMIFEGPDEQRRAARFAVRAARRYYRIANYDTTPLNRS